jgi:creatinine amidohydrolase
MTAFKFLPQTVRVQAYIPIFLIKRFREKLGERALKVLLHEMSWTEAKDYFAKSDIAILPVGSNEQHGPHNPLGTDHLIAQAIAEATAKRTGTLCLPVIPFGVSSHHRQMWGTIHISPKALKKYVKEACLSLKYYGVSKIVVVNGHGGNLPALSEMARELREEGIFVSVFQWWPAAARLLPDLFDVEERKHASAEETAVNLALHPRLVDMAKAVDEKISVHSAQAEGITLPLDTIDFSKTGVWGKSTTATVEKGKRDFEAIVEELARHVRALKKMKAEELASKPKA